MKVLQLNRLKLVAGPAGHKVPVLAPANTNKQLPKTGQ